MVFLAFVIAAYAFAFFLVPDLGDPAFKDHFATIPIFARLHIIPGGVALMLGAFQFHPGVRKRWLRLHRYSGRIYVIAVLLGAIGGLLLGWYAQRSAATRLGFSSLAVLWFYSISMAYIAVRCGNIKLHQRWMIRSYALTFAGVTLRLQLGIFQGIFDLSFDEAYDIVAWFCWILNLVVAGWLFIQSPIREKRAAG